MGAIWGASPSPLASFKAMNVLRANSNLRQYALPKQRSEETPTPTPPTPVGPAGTAVENMTIIRQEGESYFTPEGRFNTFPGRDGYDPGFLGEELPMPTLSPRLRQQAAPLLADPTQVELKYTNFSVIQHAQRAMPMITAVNIDGATHQEIDRKGSWAFDGRIAREHQMGNEAYKKNDIDRGHMVRRKETQWGPDAAKASGDTFVYTNSGLQHSDLNQKSWLDLENNILFGAVAKKEKKTVFTGPILRDSDPTFDNNGLMKRATQIPTAFWKVQVWNDEEAGGLQAQAFVLSQEDLIKGEAPARPLPGTTPPPLKVYQVEMEKLEEMTDIDFGPLTDAPDRTEADKKAIADAGIVIDDKPWLKRKTPSAAGPPVELSRSPED